MNLLVVCSVSCFRAAELKRLRITRSYVPATTHLAGGEPADSTLEPCSVEEANLGCHHGVRKWLSVPKRRRRG